MGELRKIIDKALGHLLVRTLIGFMATLATYFQYRESDATIWFWILLIVILISIILVIWKPTIELLNNYQKRRLIERTKRIEQIQKIDILTQLINEFISIERTKQFSIKNDEGINIRAVAILIVEREIGVILNIGKNENIQAGTRLKIFRRDNFTSSGEVIEQPLAVVEVKYVQIGNNCSQAVVIHQIDKDYWDNVQIILRTEQSLDPPQNFSVPYIISELSELSLEDITAIKLYLELIRSSLISNSQLANLES